MHKLLDIVAIPEDLCKRGEMSRASRVGGRSLGISRLLVGGGDLSNTLAPGLLGVSSSSTPAAITNKGCTHSISAVQSPEAGRA